MMMEIFGKVLKNVKSLNKAHKPRTLGQCTEDAAVAYLLGQGLILLARNFQPAGRGMADLDVIMQDSEKTIVFVEVRLRSSQQYGGAAGSISLAKQKRLIQAAHVFLMRFKYMPACRFDVVVFDGDGVPQWIQNAFGV